jgi:hypothetical protein
MTRDLGIWTAPDCALVLIDDQEEMFEVLPSIPSELDGIEPIDRSSMNALEDQAFRQAVETTGRKRLIVVLYVTDAAGRRSQTAHRTGIERLAASAHGGP